MAVRVVGWDGLVQDARGTVRLASGPIVLETSTLEWEGSNLRLRGWALDPNTSDPLTVTISGNTRGGGRSEVVVTASNWVQGVADQYPGYGGAFGFDVLLPPMSQVTVTAAGLPVYTQPVSHGPLNPPDRPVYAQMDPVAVEGRRIIMSGSAYDPDGPSQVVLGINDTFGGIVPVGSVMDPPSSPQAWSYSLPVGPGTFDVCALYGDYPSNVFTAPECQQVVVK